MTDELVKDTANSVKGDFGCFRQDVFLLRFYKLTMSEEDLRVMLTSQVAPQMDRNKRSRAIHSLSILQLRGEIPLDNWRPGNYRKEKQKLKKKKEREYAVAAHEGLHSRPQPTDATHEEWLRTWCSNVASVPSGADENWILRVP